MIFAILTSISRRLYAAGRALERLIGVIDWIADRYAPAEKEESRTTEAARDLI